ncbi:MAG: RNA polymerase sigma factor [Phycisphaerae bacterium]|nr:RNA polymerase sigma factor [Phycisphaerae bacterium]
MDHTDRQTIQQCLNGHPEAFRDMVRRYQGVLTAHLAGALGRRQEAEEAAQETFVRAYFGLGRLKEPDRFLAWLLGIADRVAYESARRRTRERELARVWAEARPADEISDDLALEQAVHKLPGPYRDVVLLRYYGQRSCKEVAQDLGVPLGTVTKQLSRAYALLRESLDVQANRSARSEERS